MQNTYSYWVLQSPQHYTKLYRENNSIQNPTCSCLYRVIQVLTDAPSVKQIHTDFYSVMQSHAESWGIIQSLTEPNRVLQSYTDSYRILQSHADSNRVKQSSFLVKGNFVLLTQGVGVQKLLKMFYIILVRFLTDNNVY